MFIEYSICKYILVLSLNTHIPFKWSLSKLHTLRKQIRAHISLVCEHIESERIAVQMPCCTCSFMHTQTRTHKKNGALNMLLATPHKMVQRWTCVCVLVHSDIISQTNAISIMQMKCNRRTRCGVWMFVRIYASPPPTVCLGSLGLRLVVAIMRRILTTLCADLDRPVFVTRM